MSPAPSRVVRYARPPQRKLLAVVVMLLLVTDWRAHAEAAGRRRATTQTPPVASMWLATATGEAQVPLTRATQRTAAPPATLDPASWEFAQAVAKTFAADLKAGVTTFYAVDAITGTPLFALRPDEPTNPASNVKMIATAAALDVYGPAHRFVTQVIAPRPDRAGVIHGDAYLLGSYDPTLDNAQLGRLAATLRQAGVARITGNIVVGDTSRDGAFAGRIPLTVAGITRGHPAEVQLWAGEAATTIINRTKTVRGGKSRIALAQKRIGPGLYQLTVTGRIAQNDAVAKTIAAGERRTFVANWFKEEASRVGLVIDGNGAVEPFWSFAASAMTRGQLVLPLARIESASMAELVALTNKRSINWLADRLIALAGGYAAHEPPSMASGLRLMQQWLTNRAAIAADSFTIDTGSGLSYRTRISARQLVAVVRAAGGFAHANASTDSWLASLAVGGKDGTLARRFTAPHFYERLRGKTGTLSTVIALSGVLTVNAARPIAFALVTNKHKPYLKKKIRSGHESMLTALVAWAAKRDQLAFIPASAHVERTASVPPSTATATPQAAPLDDGVHSQDALLRERAAPHATNTEDGEGGDSDRENSDTNASTAPAE